MKKATNREYNTLRNYLAQYTTGAMRKRIHSSYGITDLGWLDKGYITRVKNIVENTDALEQVKNTCLWY